MKYKDVDYEINMSTLLLEGIDSKSCIIYEDDKQRLIESNIGTVINNCCRNFGSTMDGRIKGCSSLTGIRYKCPIVVSERQKIVMFPTLSYADKTTSWIALENVLRIEPCENKSKIIFKNGKKIILDISPFTINNQYTKALKVYHAMFSKNDLEKGIF